MSFYLEKKWLLKEKYFGIENEEYFNDLKKLKSNFPLAYLIGNIPFLNCKIDLSFKPLIPRSETEFWIDVFIKEIKKKERNFAPQNSAPKNLKILDIFSGSGCIGIALLKNLKNIELDFSEININFIKQIKKNIKINFLENKLIKFKIYKSDIFKNINSKKKYDFILANPPYIDKNSKNKIEKSVLNFENHSTLFAKYNGLYFIKKIIIEGLNYLNDNGEIWIEFGSKQKISIEKILKNKKIKKYKFLKDQYNKNRILIISKN